MGHGAAYYWKGKHEATQFFAAVPFGLTAQEMNGWLYHAGGLELWGEFYDQFDLIPAAAGNTGVQMGGWFNKEINSLADLQGLKMYSNVRAARLSACPAEKFLPHFNPVRSMPPSGWGPTMTWRLVFTKLPNIITTPVGMNPAPRWRP